MSDELLFGVLGLGIGAVGGYVLSILSSPQGKASFMSRFMKDPFMLILVDRNTGREKPIILERKGDVIEYKGSMWVCKESKWYFSESPAIYRNSKDESGKDIQEKVEDAKLSKQGAQAGSRGGYPILYVYNDDFIPTSLGPIQSKLSPQAVQSGLSAWYLNQMTKKMLDMFKNISTMQIVIILGLIIIGYVVFSGQGEITNMCKQAITCAQNTTAVK